MAEKSDFLKKDLRRVFKVSLALVVILVILFALDKQFNSLNRLAEKLLKTILSR